MSQKANPTLIGIFVFGAILIAIGAAIFFGSADIFSKKQLYVSYFNQSISGLAVGSNVKFKGVTIGKVTKILLGFVGEDKPIYAKVFYEVDEKLAARELGPRGINLDLSDPVAHAKRIERGLRARLDFESLISGQLYVSLDFIKVDAAPAVFHQTASDEKALEIPVQPSDIEAIVTNLTKAVANIGNVDFLTISKNLESLIVNARDGIESLKLADLGTSLNNLVNGPDLKGALTSIKQSFDQLDATIKKLDKELDPISSNLNPTLEEAKKAMGQLQSATAHLDKMLSTNSSFRYQLDSALSQIGTAADSLRRLSEFLERNPNSIIFGRKPAKQQQ
ncbi:MAG TPA: MlaD family protein [Chthoniobacterales bacterium]|nr:MlaD family protein [Chthoniobacterales bacterium]